MAKAERNPQLDLRNLSDQILLNALPRIAHVLKPYPADAKPEDINEVVAKLGAAGLAHVGGKSPNLTAKGVEAARALAEKQTAKG